MRLRSILVVCATATVIGCGGGHGGDGGGSTSPPPTATLSGVAFASSPFLSGTVTAYSFAAGTKGSMLASTTLTSGGGYSLTTTAGAPVLLEVAGGCYTEIGTDRTGAGQVLATVCQNAGEVLQTVVTPSSGNVSVNVTPYTHVAAGLATYLIGQSATPANATATANQHLSSVVGLDIVATMPVTLDSTTVATTNSEYGALLGGMASWIYSFRWTTVGFTFGTTPYTTINLAELMRNDLAHDGILDGVGTTTNGDTTTLKIAATTVDAAVERHQIAAYGVSFVRGHVSSTNYPSDFLTFLARYNNSTDSIFGLATVTALDEGGPTLTIVLPGNGFTNVSGDITVKVNLTDIVGVPANNVHLLVDGVSYKTFPGGATYVDPGSDSVTLHTPDFSNGNHVISVTATNLLTTTTSASVSGTFQN